MTPPACPLLPAEIAGWLERANSFTARTRLSPAEINELDADYQRTHPFFDGSGRTGRLTLSLLLVRLRYPPTIIYKSQRATYWAVLRRADSGDPGAFGELITRAVLDKPHKFINPAVAGRTRLVPLVAPAPAELNAPALMASAVRGTLRASKRPEGQWRSNRSWVDDFVRTRDRRRP